MPSIYTNVISISQSKFMNVSLYLSMCGIVRICNPTGNKLSDRNKDIKF